MEFRGSSVYDQEEFFSAYMKRRGRKDSPNNAIETPIIYELAGDFQNKTILDLGCGDASFGKELLERGAASYTGVEGSEQMLEAAKQNLSGVNGTVFHHTMQSYGYPEETFDLVASRFAIHYVPDIEPLFQNVHSTLKNGGKFIFSVQHPVTTASFNSKTTGDRRENWIVDDYFRSGERKEPWIGQVVVKYHRTIEQYFSALIRCGFSVTSLREGTPVRENFADEKEYERRRRIPVVLAFSCVKN
ncbi:bifunctional 2-polyprenyl-6-hydroxyphenol methylase/3-demethylubiquinol 3-O-methyltransferase UbiG [Planomicrobium sp. CPCC 101079]|uniref:class I SAM-dependent methyltransferase n=1 Tax=Planomicrobium sp. CPCC 101079 TaxID=2599618 RepID=UPI0011B721E8|nr:class I SAM-dependent methyltransferase [Planomicrobium sp. CPCC 101079]TWT01878.1 class I SAM-dependent methyltransferase [Planomicrobium sp. CPCC 101079]